MENGTHILNAGISNNSNGNVNGHGHGHGNTSASASASGREVEAGDVEDDLSYDGGGRSIMSDDRSQGSSVYIDDSDDGSYASYSDSSSVHVNMNHHHRPSKSSSSSPDRMRSGSGHSRSSSRSRSASPSLQKRPQRPRDLNGMTTPTKKNTSASASASTNTSFTSDAAVPVQVASSTTYKGRYENATPTRNRGTILKQLQRRVRAPSPVPSVNNANANARRLPKKLQMDKHESQTSLIYKSIPGFKIKHLVASLSPGQYVMLLRPGMLGVNLKQTYLPGHGVYVDFVVPGGNAGNAGVICIGDGLVKVGDLDVSKGTIHDVPRVIANSKRPAILVLNGEHDMKLEEVRYLLSIDSCMFHFDH